LPRVGEADEFALSFHLSFQGRSFDLYAPQGICALKWPRLRVIDGLNIAEMSAIAPFLSGCFVRFLRMREYHTDVGVSRKNVQKKLQIFDVLVCINET
jgi:hypothetical protein